MSKRPTIIGITLGDINGIGPEIALKAAFAKRPPGTRLVFIGDHDTVAREARRRRRATPPAWNPEETPVPAHGVTVWNPAPASTLTPRPGTCTVGASRAAYRWIVAATEAALRGRLAALVTAPINKDGFQKAGVDAPGHTELLAALSGTTRFEMMLLADDFRVVLATRHIPIKDVAGSLTRSGVRQTIEMTADALRWLGVRRKRIAVCGLNPHAGDGGAIGKEEQTIIRPAMRAVRRKGIVLSGPVPADSVFRQVREGAYDAVVAMYHDQALAPFKMVAFEKGVNLTLGLPFVRTSPDHGTAYGLAGKGKADPSSMIEAIALAAKLATRPNPWRGP